VSVLYRADGLAPESHLDYWRQVLDSVFMPIELTGDFGPSASAEMRTSVLGPVRLNDSRTSTSFRTVRTTRHIRDSSPDVWLVGLLVNGGFRVEQDDRQALLRPGELSVVDPSRPSTRHFTPMQTLTVSIPKAMVPLHDQHLAQLTARRIRGDHGAGALAAQLDRPSAAAEAGERTLLHRVHAYVEDHLGDPELSPRHIAAAHHISLHSLYKLFEAEDLGVAEWIRSRRLAKCRRDLLDPMLRDVPVSAIGARWGLVDAAHFSRIFRAAHGLPPVEFRRMHQVTSTVHSG
jgi:AraC-like DNA-binding protein